MIYKKLQALLQHAIQKKVRHKTLSGLILEPPRERKHGDYYTNAAFLLAKEERCHPQEAAEALAKELEKDRSLVARVEVAGKGFLNLWLSGEMLLSEFRRLVTHGAAPFYPQTGKGKRVLLEFVSANPTGPLHVGNGRGGVIGDVLGNLLNRCGFRAEKEYYINDGREGTQMEKLGASFRARLKESLKEKVPFPEDGYPGEYLRQAAEQLPKSERKKLLQDPSLISCMQKASALILEAQQKTLKNFGISFDSFVHEDDLVQGSHVQKVLQALQAKGALAEREGAVWFLATAWGEKKDEVLVRSNRKPTYFLTDIAYHQQKFQRGVGALINIWGADHHGHIERLKSALQTLGLPSEKLTILLYQLVRLVEHGEPMKMSKRGGDYITLDELIREVGQDAARIFFLSRDSRSPLDFDIQLAKEQNMANPAYYVQYAQVRVRSLYRKKEEMELKFLHGQWRWDDLEEEEQTLVKQCLLLEVACDKALRAYEPHRLYFYLLDLAALFHAYYQKFPILTAPEPKRSLRWHLVQGVEVVLRELFSLLGIRSLESM